MQSITFRSTTFTIYAFLTVLATAISRTNLTIFFYTWVAFSVTTILEGQAKPIHTSLLRLTGTIRLASRTVFTLIRFANPVTAWIYLFTNPVLTLGALRANTVRWTVAAVFPVRRVAYLVSTHTNGNTSIIEAHLTWTAITILGADSTIFTLFRFTSAVSTMGCFYATPLHTLCTWLASTTLDQLVAAIIPSTALETHLIASLWGAAIAIRHAYLA